MSEELEKYGIAPQRWGIDEHGRVLFLYTDLSIFTIHLTAAQIDAFKNQCAYVSEHYGRKWQDGYLLIPVKKEEKQ